MIKKILLTIIAVLVAGGALVIYGSYKAADEYVKEKEPQLRAYVQMDEAAQNQYVLENADELLAQASAEAKPEDKADVDFFNKVKDDPAVQKALTDLGRAIMAVAVLHSEEIVADLSDKAKAQFELEKSQLKTRLEAYGEVLEKAEEKLKAAQ